MLPVVVSLFSPLFYNSGLALPPISLLLNTFRKLNDRIPGQSIIFNFEQIHLIKALINYVYEYHTNKNVITNTIKMPFKKVGGNILSVLE